MGHGGGGALSAELVEHLFAPAFGSEALAALGDSAVADAGRRPAGLLHRLVRGAAAVLPRRQHRRPGRQRHGQRPGHERRPAGVPVLRASSWRRASSCPSWAGWPQAIGAAAAAAGVTVVTGDTKVVEAGHGDGVYLNTSGIGLIPDGVDIRPQRAAPGDVVIVSGPIGVHGIAIMSVREGLEFGVGRRERHRAAGRPGGGDAGGHARTCTCCATPPAAGSPPR